MPHRSRIPVSPVREAPSPLTTAERRAGTLRPTVYCPPSALDKCLDKDVGEAE